MNNEPEDMGEYFKQLITQRQKEDDANELMQTANINFSPNAPRISATDIEPEQKSLGIRAIKDIGWGIYESPGSIVNGVSDAIQETLHAGEDLIEWIDGSVAKGKATEDVGENEEYAFEWKQPFQKRTTVTGQAIEDITQFVVGFIGAGKFIKPLKYVAKDSNKRKIAKAIAKGSVADATVFGPQEERLSNLIESVPALRNPVTDFLKADSNDSKAYGRLKAGIEGIFIGGAAEALPMIIRSLRGQAKDQIDNTLKFEKQKKQDLLDDAHLEPDWADDLGPTTGPKSKTKITGFGVRGREDLQRPIKDFTEEEIKTDPMKKMAHSFSRAAMPEINFNKINTEQDVVDLVKELGDSKEGKKILKEYKQDRASIKASKEDIKLWELKKEELGPTRGKFYDLQTHMMVTDAARLNGVDIEVMLKKYKNGQLLTEEEVAKQGVILYSSQRKLGNIIYGMAKNIKNNVNTKQGMVLAHDALNTHLLIRGHWDETGSQMGKSFRMRQYVKNITDGRVLKEFFDNQLSKMAGGEALLLSKMKHLAQLWDQGLDIGAKNVAVAEMMGAKNMDRVLEVFINGILSGPKTHLVNMIGNTVVIGMRLAEVGVARLIARTIGNEDLLKGELLAEAHGMMKGFQDMMRFYFRTAVKGGPNTKTPIGYDLTQTKLDAGQTGAIHTSKMKMDDAYKTTMGPAINLVGAAIRLPGNFLMHEDAFFKVIGYRMGLHKHSYRQALADFETFKKSGKTTTLDDAVWIKNKQADIMKQAEKGNDKYKALKLQAHDQAHLQTFTNMVGPGGQKIQSLLLEKPMLRFIVPFFRTPYNIMNYVFERSPVSVLRPKFQRQLAGKEGKETQMLAMSKISMGYMATMWAFDQVNAGNLTGLSNQQKGELQVKRRMGIQPYSVKIGDKWFAYNRTDPFGMILGLAADVAEIHQATEDATGDEFELMDILGSSIMAISNNVINKTYLSGLAELIEMMGDPTRHGEAYIKRFLGGFIPYSSLQREVKKATDPYLLETVQYLDNVRKDTLGLGAGLYPRRDFWGNKIPAQNMAFGDNTISQIYDSVSPIYASKEARNPVDMEFLRLGISPRPPRRNQRVGNQKFDMAKYGEDYDRLKVITNQVKIPKYNNKTLYQTLYSKVSGKGYEAKLYQTLSDEDKTKYIRNIISDYNTAARNIVFSSPKNHKLRHLIRGG